jgi:hypothetical protein
MHIKDKKVDGDNAQRTKESHLFRELEIDSFT